MKARRLGIHTQHESIVFMRTDCPVCRSEGLSPRSQVILNASGRSAYATLYQVSSDFLSIDEIGIAESTWAQLGASEGEPVVVRHPPRLESFGFVRGRIFGNRFAEPELGTIVEDIVAGRYSDVHLSSFLTASAAIPLDLQETIALTRVMVEAGARLSWPSIPIVDKHSVGGLPGNRTTPIVVAIVASLGLTMPKTSSRAITSPAGTADTMETLAPVDLDLPAIRRVVEQESGCIVWGGSVRLSPADDVIIRVERVLDIDTEGQLIASVLSKKIAAGSSHLVLDVPVGPTAKVRSAAAAASLSARLEAVAKAFGVRTRIVIGNGEQPIGRGIGPALEARDVLAVLQGRADAPPDLRRRALELAGALLELAGRSAEGRGSNLARQALDDGRAWAKFQGICEAQGGMRVPPAAWLQHPLPAGRSGRVTAIDNRRLAILAKLAGAPDVKAAGVDLHVRLGDEVGTDQPVCTVHSMAPGELAYALDYASVNPGIISIEDA
ncbi:MAG: thymidine phosphorylase family protein [Dehalococcoidia bacterium]